MTMSCTECPLRALDCFVPMSEKDVEAMERFKVGELSIDKKTSFIAEGSTSPHLYTVLGGMGIRYKLLPDGQRQVINLIFPGDFIGLQGELLGEMQHSAETSTDMTLCIFDRGELWSFFRSNPERAYHLTWLAAIEEHFLGAALATVGQKTARERLAWALARSMRRGAALGLVTGHRMTFPFRQQDIADALGLSLVHTNKTLARCREEGLAEWRNDLLSVPDLARLEDIALIDEPAVTRRPLM